jgi:hypothetical protein
MQWRNRHTLGRNAQETGSPWAVMHNKYRQNLKSDHLERPKLEKKSFEENRRILWEEAKILDSEKNAV